MVTSKGKGRESAVATWPAPSDPSFISPRKSTHRPKLSQSIFAQPQTTQHSSQTPPLAEGGYGNGNHGSNTWTSSSENPDLPSEDGNDNRERFILEYNRLAQRHGIRPIVPGDFSSPAGQTNGVNNRRSSWLFKVLRQTSAQSEKVTTNPNKTSFRHQRRPSDVASDFVHGKKRDGLKNQDLRALVRLCGKSPLFLPTDYASSSLTLPTCLRALAQALVQHIDTKGIFRVSGSARVVNALYDYYCTDDNTEAISSTTRCPTLPSHIKCNAHDIASTFKRFLAGLPGGILGSLSLFDALVAIHTQLQGDPEWHRTKESKLRARLIALAIGTVKSQYQRELICAVFGLLCLVGRVAENAPREDENGRPLPTGDLMGYNSLGIIFGPLLIGDMIKSYSTKVADPSAGLVLLPITLPKSRKEKRSHRRGRRHAKTPSPDETPSLTVDKINIANSITEMLIVHWREVVRQIRSTGSVRTRRSALNPQHTEGVSMNLSTSASEHFSLRNPAQWEHVRRRSGSPSTASLTATPRTSSASTVNQQDNLLGQRTPQAQEGNILISGPTQKPSIRGLPHLLSPTLEESPSPRIETKLSRGKQKATNEAGDDLNKTSYHKTPSRARESSSRGSIIRPAMTSNASATGGDTIADTFRSPARKPKTPSPSPLVVRRTRAHVIPHSYTSPSSLGQPGDTMKVESILIPDIEVDSLIPSSNSFTGQAASRHKHEVGAPDLETLHQTMGGSESEISRLDLDDAVIDGAGQSHTEINRPLDLHHSPHGGRSRNGGIPKSTTDPHLSGRGRFTPTRLPGLEYTPSGVRNNYDFEGQALTRSPAYQGSLVATSKASTESLAKSAQKRRSKRNSGNASSRSSRESFAIADPRATTPERKQRPVQDRNKVKEKSTAAWLEQKVLPEEPPRLVRPTLNARRERFSPEKIPGANPHRESSWRSASKPVPGAVKAMTALFDNAAKKSPDRPATVLSGRTRNSLIDASNSPYRDAVGGSPTKLYLPGGARKSPVGFDSTPGRDRYSPTRKGSSTVRALPSRLTRENTPTKPLRDTLRPLNTSSRKELQPPSKPAHEIDHRSQPPKLGAMIPHQEEPPVGHFMRPSSASSAQSRNVSIEPPLDSRHTSGASFLHAQIRSLQRQLELRNEEILHLRRRLETQEQLDIGTLCEQLRVAKRECLMWRKRAEAAERRVAVLQQFGSKFQALTDGVDDERRGFGGLGGGSPSCSVWKENREVFENRLRYGFMEKMGPRGADAAIFDDGVGEVGARSGFELRRSTSRRTVGLWDTAQELVDFQHGGSMRV